MEIKELNKKLAKKIARLLATLAFFIFVIIILAVKDTNLFQMTIAFFSLVEFPVFMGLISIIVLIVGVKNFLSWLQIDAQQRKTWKYSISLVFLIILIAISGITNVAILHQTAWLSREGLGSFDIKNDLEAKMAILINLKKHPENDKEKKFDQELKKTLFFLRRKWKDEFQFFFISNKEKEFSAVIASPYPNRKFAKEDYHVTLWHFGKEWSDTLIFYRTSPQKIIENLNRGIIKPRKSNDE